MHPKRQQQQQQRQQRSQNQEEQEEDLSVWIPLSLSFLKGGMPEALQGLGATSRGVRAAVFRCVVLCAPLCVCESRTVDPRTCGVSSVQLNTQTPTCTRTSTAPCNETSPWASPPATRPSPASSARPNLSSPRPSNGPTRSSCPPGSAAAAAPWWRRAAIAAPLTYQ